MARKLDPGTYAASMAKSGLTVTFDVDKEGWIGELDPAFVTLRRDPALNPDGVPAAVSFVHFGGLLFADPCVVGATRAVERTAAALIGALAKIAALQATPPSEMAVAGFPAIAIDVTVDVSKTCAASKEVVLWGEEYEWGFVLAEGETAWVAALDVGDRTLVIVAETWPGGNHDRLLQDAQPILDSLVVTATP